jgi:hypothetical protein
MKRTYSLMLVGVMALVPVTRATDRVVTTDAGTGAGSLTAAINALVDGDRITFNIPPAAGEVHYIQVPTDGFPIITNNNITIDGYTQAGASPNTASIHAANNAVLKIVLTATNGNALSMYTACKNSWGSDIGGVDGDRFGYGDSEQAILGFFHATNAVVRGFVFQATPLTATSQSPPNTETNPFDDGPTCKAICFAANSLENGGGNCKNWRVSGCWFGLDPVTKQVVYCQDVYYSLGQMVASPFICIASYRTRNATGPDATSTTFNSGTVGVAPGTAGSRGDFNCFVTGYGFDSEGNNYRFSGNFWNVLPDGVTAVDMGVIGGTAGSFGQQGDGYIEVGRSTCNLTIGTDGDGVNDADEGNIFTPMTVDGTCLNFYSDPQTNIVIAGNYFGYNAFGVPFTNVNINPLVDSLQGQSTCRFGTDGNGVSDAVEGNMITNCVLVAKDDPASYQSTWISMRRNSLQACKSNGGTTPPIGEGTGEGANVYGNYIDLTNSVVVVTPVIGAANTTSLSGTCGNPTEGPYSRLVVDIYEAADTSVVSFPQGKRWIASFTDNSAADSNAAVGAFTFNTTGLGITAGMNLTIAVTYSRDIQPTIASVARAGSTTTLTVTDAAAQGPGYVCGIDKSSAVSPTSWASAGTAVSGTATFTDSSNPASFYRAQGPTSTGQTSPFSAIVSAVP